MKQAALGVHLFILQLFAVGLLGARHQLCTRDLRGQNSYAPTLTELTAQGGADIRQVITLMNKIPHAKEGSSVANNQVTHLFQLFPKDPEFTTTAWDEANDSCILE